MTAKENRRSGSLTSATSASYGTLGPVSWDACNFISITRSWSYTKDVSKANRSLVTPGASKHCSTGRATSAPKHMASGVTSCANEVVPSWSFTVMWSTPDEGKLRP